MVDKIDPFKFPKVFEIPEEWKTKTVFQLLQEVMTEFPISMRLELMIIAYHTAMHAIMLDSDRENALQGLACLRMIRKNLCNWKSNGKEEDLEGFFNKPHNLH